MIRKSNKSVNAMVLVLCVWLLIIMIIGVLGVVHSNRINSYVASNVGVRVKAKWAARAGIYYAIDEIMRNPSDFNDSLEILGRLSSAGKQPLTQTEAFSLIAYDTERNNIEYGIIDESAKINLLTATDRQVAELLDVSLDQAKNSLKLFNDSLVYSDNKMISAVLSSDMYLRNIRLIAIESQLSLDDCFGEDTNMNGILEWNENDGAIYPPFDNSDGQLETGLLHNSTLYSYERNIDRNGVRRVNINELDEEELVETLEISLSEALWIQLNRPFGSVAELFPDMITSTDFEGEIPISPTSVELQNKTIINEDGSEEILPVPMSVNTIRRIYSKITTIDDSVIPGKVNINTANRDIIAATLGITKEQADAVIKKRESLPQGFHTTAEIFSTGVFDYMQFVNVVDLLTVQGNIFTIVSRGECLDKNVYYTIEATVDISNSNPVFLFWKEY